MATKKHFVLVHGACHGAWCWYKLVPLLKSNGHKVTALDLGACGVNPKQLDELPTIYDYVQPLMELLSCLPQDERVILVGHSYGGLSISLAMEKFPEKILVAVFVTAYMPNCINPPATILEEYFKSTPAESLYDCQLVFGHGPDNPPTSSTVGPVYLTKVVYPKCKPQDLELAKMLVRPTGVFFEDLNKESVVTEAKFGSVSRVYVVCEEDAVMKVEFQNWLITNSPPKQVKFIGEAGHMVMLSKPEQLSQCLENIALQY